MIKWHLYFKSSQLTEAFNEYFINITKSNSYFNASYLFKRITNFGTQNDINVPLTKLKYITVSDSEKAINSLKNKNSSGWYEIPNKIIKYVCDKISCS